MKARRGGPAPAASAARSAVSLRSAFVFLVVGAWPVAASVRLRIRARAAGSGATGDAVARHAAAPEVFDQLRSLRALSGAGETAAGHEEVHKELYKVAVHFSVQEMEPSKGVTMVFDRKKDEMVLSQGLKKAEGLAWGHFVDNIDYTGWSELHIEATDSGMVSNDVRSYAAGFVEGILTCVRLSEFNANTRRLLLRKDDSVHALGHVKKLLDKQLKYMKKMAGVNREAMAEEPEETYWKHIRYVLFQLWGICDGYNRVARHYGVHEMSLEDLAVLNSAGELPQLMEAFSPKARTTRAAFKPSLMQVRLRRRLQLRARRSRHGLSSHEVELWGPSNSSVPQVSREDDELDDTHWERRVIEDGRCSALVRFPPGGVDLLIGHTTWDDYAKMTRIFKYYKLPLGRAETMATHIAMSSYPGVVGSTDDFYVMDSGLGVMETSLIIMDPMAWVAVEEFNTSPHVPNFAHIMAVNRLAKSGAHWARLFMSSNTGTYTSQWLVVDYNKFRVGHPLDVGGFWVVEAVPGAVHAEDMTAYLNKHGYFPSFNRPYFSPIRDKSGHTAAQRSHGALYSWDKNPRARIFAAVAPTITAPAGMRALMNHNAFPHTLFVGGSAGHEVSARMDLVQGLHLPNGGIDAKVSSQCLQKRMQVQAISGPSHETLAPFRWVSPDGRDTFPDWPHIGQPNVWNFTYVQMSPTGMSFIQDEDQFQC